MVPDVISNGLALFFSWLFAMAALHKLRSQAYYLNLLLSYFPRLPMGQLVVRLVGVCELMVAVFLLVGPTRSAALLACASLLLIYAGLMGWQIKRGRDDIDCGCSGPASTLTISPALVLRNVLCAGLAMYAWVAPVVIVEGLTAYGLSAYVAVFLILLYLCSDQLIANTQQMAGEH